MTYAVYYSIEVLHPTIGDSCAFVQFLVNSLSSPQTITNYISGARIWIFDHGGEPAALGSREAKAVHTGAFRQKWMSQFA